MKAPSANPCIAKIADAELLHRVLRQNQEQIIGTLLHDLRNPVHSMRITVELLDRLAQKDADTDALLARAARYVGPAESALTALTRQADRLSTYLGPPGPPAAEPIAVNDWLAEVATLLRGSTQEVDAKFESTLGDQVSLTADRPRLSHALLRWCLSNADGPVLLSARETESDRIQILATSKRWTTDHAGPRFTAEELGLLIDRAGGRLSREVDDAVALSFPGRRLESS
jgi:hypothetical protein